MAAKTAKDARQASDDLPWKTGRPLVIATILVLVPIIAGLVLLGESRPGLVRIALYNFRVMPLRATLVAGFAGGFALAGLLALAKPLATRRLPSWIACLPPALLTGAFWAATAAWLPDPLAPASEMSFGARAKITAARLAGVASLADAALVFGALALTLGALIIRPKTKSFASYKRPGAALAVAILGLAAAAWLSLRYAGAGPRALETAPWLCALPAGAGLASLVLGGDAAKANDEAASRLLWAVAASLGGIFLAAHVAFAGDMPRIAVWDAKVETLGASAAALREHARVLVSAGLFFAAPVVLTMFVAMPRKAIGAGLKKLRPLSIVFAIVALSPILLIVRTEAMIRRIETLAHSDKNLRGAPGALVPDPDLPAGTLVVDLLGIPSIGDHLVPAEQARVSYDKGVSIEPWSPDEPSRFSGLTVGPHELHTEGPYIGQRVHIEWPDSTAGARLLLPALPIAPKDTPLRSALAPKAYAEPVQHLEIDTTAQGDIALRWMEGRLVHEVRTAARTRGPGEVLSYPELAAAVKDVWQEKGLHRDPSDRRVDFAVVRARLEAPFEETRAALEAALATLRDRKTIDGLERIPVFEVMLAEPRPAPPRLLEDVPEPVKAALTQSATGAELDAEIERCRKSPCAPAFHARLFFARGARRVLDNNAEAVSDFRHARALDPSIQPRFETAGDLMMRSSPPSDLTPDPNEERLAQRFQEASTELPSVLVEKQSSRGRLAEAEIESRLALLLTETRFCYLEALSDKKDLEGRFTLRFVVGRDGIVGKVDLDAQGLPDPLVSCVRRFVEVLSFPAPEQGIFALTQNYLLSPKAPEPEKDGDSEQEPNRK